MGLKTNRFGLQNLTTQISLIVIGIPTLVLVAFGLYQIHTQTILFEKKLDISLQNEADQLSASLSTALFNFDDETCQVICKAALKKSEILKLVIRDSRGIYQSFEANGYKDLDFETEGKLIQVPIFFKDEKIGSLEMTATTRQLEQRVKALKATILWSIFILDIILGLVMGLVLLVRFVRPLKALQMDSEKIAAGHLDHPINLGRRDELGSLASNLLTMRDAVREKVASLESEINRHQKTALDLKITKDHMDNILDSMPSVIISLDEQMRVTQWNRRAQEVYGVPMDEATGRSVIDMVPELYQNLDKIRTHIGKGEVCFLPKQVRVRAGEMVYEDITVYPLISEYAKEGVIRVDDVTEHFRMEQMVVQSEKMMSVGGLAAGMAHEINNPLAGMMQNAQVILRRIEEDMPASLTTAREAGTTLGAIRQFMEKRGLIRQLNSIRHAGDRASQIVRNMLSFSRDEAAGKTMQNIAELMDKTIELAKSDYDLKKQYDFKTIEVVREYQADVPLISCEASKIQQVFYNIIKNSAEAMQEDKPGKSPRLLLRIFQKDDFIEIEIADNGPGMDEGTCKRVFEPFFTTKAVGQGTGLGLSVSYFIITDNHRGKMSVVSTPGRGTRFIILLPLS